MNTDTTALYLDAVSKGIEKSRLTIKHCVDQVSQEQFWWRPEPDMNSIANILLHLSGNIRQWIIAGMNGAIDDRDRPKEFQDRSGAPKDLIWKAFSETLDEARLTLSRMNSASLGIVRKIQGYEVNGVDAIYNSTSHLQGHTQEIIYITRMLLGSSYKFYYTPPG